MTLVELYTVLQNECLYTEFIEFITSKKGTIH